MSTLTLDGKAIASNPAAHRSRGDTLRIAGLALLCGAFSLQQRTVNGNKFNLTVRTG
jgi:hypothetical protein